MDILRQGCVIFSRLIKDVTNVFPFYDKTCHTIAGLALKIYRTNFLNEETIGQIPAQGYGGNVNQSTIALYWLRDVAEKLRTQGLLFNSKLTAGGERCILGRFVDGYCESTRTIYQFHGCFFHGCIDCYDGEAYNTVLNETFYTLRERTKRTTQLFQQHGYTVLEMWECNFKYESGLNNGLINVLRSCDFFANTNLNPRDALFGGRTSPAIMYYEFTPEEKGYEMKALLNSLWGKLAQNENTTVVSFIDNLDMLLELVNDHSITVTSLDFISDNIARTTHIEKSRR